MTDVLRVLLVEDLETDAKLVVAELHRTWKRLEFERVQTGDAKGSPIRPPWPCSPTTRQRSFANQALAYGFSLYAGTRW